MAICNFNYRSDRIYLPGYSGTDLRAVKRNDTVCSRRYMRQANAASGLSQLKSQIESSGQNQNVVGCGMKVNDGGTASFFAVLKKSSAEC